MLVAIVAVALAAPAVCRAVPADTLTGIWMSRQLLGPEVRGELTVRRQRGRWSSAIGRHAPVVRVVGDSIQIAVPGDRGSFRGRRDAGGKLIEGFWIQPAGDPVGTEQPFATRMTLRAAGPGTWKGTVAPLDETFTLYLGVSRDTTGRLIAAFRNPEYNADDPGARRGLLPAPAGCDGLHLRTSA